MDQKKVQHEPFLPRVRSIVKCFSVKDDDSFRVAKGKLQVKGNVALEYI